MMALPEYPTGDNLRVSEEDTFQTPPTIYNTSDVKTIVDIPVEIFGGAQ